VGRIVPFPLRWYASHSGMSLACCAALAEPEECPSVKEKGR
jgi:hypothetical protein